MDEIKKGDHIFAIRVAFKFFFFLCDTVWPTALLAGPERERNEHDLVMMSRFTKREKVPWKG